MDTQQLKLLAKSLRVVFKQDCAISISHLQSLNFIAAIPGLRKWAEVSHFPELVAACQFDRNAANRLSRRIEKQLGPAAFPPNFLLSRLGSSAPPPLQIWPTGPAAGIYVTFSRDAIQTLVEQFDIASDGSMVFAEYAGHDSRSLSLGDSGFWSDALQGAQSGTLLVLGPLRMTQGDWKKIEGNLNVKNFLSIGMVPYRHFR